GRRGSRRSIALIDRGGLRLLSETGWLTESIRVATIPPAGCRPRVPMHHLPRHRHPAATATRNRHRAILRDLCSSLPSSLSSSSSSLVFSPHSASLHRPFPSG